MSAHFPHAYTQMACRNLTQSRYGSNDLVTIATCMFL